MYRRYINKFIYLSIIISSSSTAAATGTSPYQSFAGQHFEELDEHLAVAQVDVQVLDAAVDTHQVRVDPLGERLLLHALTLVCRSHTHTHTVNTSSHRHTTTVDTGAHSVPTNNTISSATED